jgi:hypothetical protein
MGVVALQSWATLVRKEPMELPGRLAVCNGMPRSASTWSFNVVTELFRAEFGRVVGAYDEDIGHFLARVPGHAPCAVVKCHTLDPLGRWLTRTGRVPVIYTRRDPADAVASAMKMWSLDFEVAFATVKPSLDLSLFHAQTRRTLMLEYEDIVADPLDSVAQVASYLGVDASNALLGRVADLTGMERMREKADRLTAVDERGTLLHPGHIQDGGIGYGREVLTPAQLTRVDRAWLGSRPTTRGADRQLIAGAGKVALAK